MLLASVAVFACKCNIQSFGENFAQNDFVAEIEILKVYNIDFSNEEDDRFYKADIKILKLYKGKEVLSIFVKGKVDEVYNSACEIAVKKGNKFLIYLDTKNDFTLSSCTAKKDLNDSDIDKERKALEFLIEKKINNTNCFYFSGDYFEKFKNLKSQNDFAVYQLKINSKSKIESVSVLQNFGSSEDKNILNIIKKEFTVLKDFMVEMKNEEVTLVLFLDKEKDEIISNFN